MYLSKLHNVSVKIATCLSPNYKTFLTTLVQGQQYKMLWEIITRINDAILITESSSQHLHHDLRMIQISFGNIFSSGKINLFTYDSNEATRWQSKKYIFRIMLSPFSLRSFLGVESIWIFCKTLKVGKAQDWQCFDSPHKNVLCFSLQGFFAAVKVYPAFNNIEF